MTTRNQMKQSKTARSLPLADEQMSSKSHFHTRNLSLKFGFPERPKLNNEAYCQ